MHALKQRVHPTWMLTVLCAALLAGIALARYTAVVPAWSLVVGVFAIIISFWWHKAWMLALIIIGGVMVGLWRGGCEMSGIAVYRYVVGRQVIVTGLVSADPQANAKGGQAVAITNITANGQHFDGTLYVTTNETPVLRRDDTVTVKGALSAGYGNYAAFMHDASVEQVVRHDNVALDVRDTFNAATRQALTEPAASLGIGILVGQKTALPTDFTDALKIAGLTHIVVASGYNLTILVRFSRRLFSKISRYQAAIWGIALILGFMAITGWSASMTRAGLVAGLSLLAWYYGRKTHPVTLLLFAAAVTAMVYPPYAWNDAGWALSFAAFAGVIILAPLLHAYFYADKKPGAVGQVILETFAAQVATLPIMLGVFGQLSIVALLSNMMILPFISFGMLFTFIAGVGQLILPGVAHIIAFPAQLLLDYVVWAVNWTASFPWAQVQWQMTPWGVALTYSGLIGVCVYLSRVTHYNLRQVNVVE